MEYALWERDIVKAKPQQTIKKLDDDAFLEHVLREESAIYQQTSEALVAWQNEARLGQRLRPPTRKLKEVDDG